MGNKLIYEEPVNRTSCNQVMIFTSPSVTTRNKRVLEIGGHILSSAVAPIEGAGGPSPPQDFQNDIFF